MPPRGRYLERCCILAALQPPRRGKLFEGAPAGEGAPAASPPHEVPPPPPPVAVVPSSAFVVSDLAPPLADSERDDALSRRGEARGQERAPDEYVVAWALRRCAVDAGSAAGHPLTRLLRSAVAEQTSRWRRWSTAGRRWRALRGR